MAGPALSIKFRHRLGEHIGKAGGGTGVIYLTGYQRWAVRDVQSVFLGSSRLFTNTLKGDQCTVQYRSARCWSQTKLVTQDMLLKSATADTSTGYAPGKLQ